MSKLLIYVQISQTFCSVLFCDYFITTGMALNVKIQYEGKFWLEKASTVHNVL